MQVVVLGCLLGAGCVMGLWTAVAAHATINKTLRRGGRPVPARW
jgi:hypothetical protein